MDISVNKTMKINKRENWIDVSRAILIILVVVGHFHKVSHWQLTNLTDYVFLFHMPAFFIISGYLYKPLKHISEIRTYIIKKIKRLLVPYISYLVLITLIRYLYIFSTTGFSKHDFIVDLLKNFFGGQYLNYNCGVLWFLTCLFFTEIVWAVLDVIVKSIPLKLIIIISFYLIAHLQALYFSGLKIPLGIDLVLLTLSYYCFGVYFKKYLFNKYIITVSLVFSIVFLTLRLFNISDYGFEIVIHHYNDVLLDFLVPVMISIVIFNIAYHLKWLSQNMLLKIGSTTLAIMCLHLAINTIFQSVINYGLVIFTIIGVLLPLIIAVSILEKSSLLSKCFLGK